MRNVKLSRPFPCAAHNCTLDIYPPANEKLEAPIHLSQKGGNKIRGGRAQHRVIPGDMN